MKTFKTLDGTDWKVVVTVGTVKRVLDDTGLKLTDMFTSQKATEQFLSDDIKFCELLWSVVRPQAAEAGVTIDQFFSTIDGTVVENAAEALVSEIVDFFQEPRRSVLRKIWARYQEAKQRCKTEDALAAEKAMEKVDFDQLVRQTHTSSASSSPASAA